MTIVTLFNGSHFNGEYKTFAEDDGNLTDNLMSLFSTWDNKASSVSVVGGWVKLYQHDDFGGAWLNLGPGNYDVSFMNHWNMNDAISSVDIL